MACSEDQLALGERKALKEARATKGMREPRLASEKPRESRQNRGENRSARVRAGWREVNLDSPGAKQSLRNAEELGGRGGQEEWNRLVFSAGC